RRSGARIRGRPARVPGYARAALLASAPRRAPEGLRDRVRTTGGAELDDLSNGGALRDQPPRRRVRPKTRPRRRGFKKVPRPRRNGPRRPLARLRPFPPGISLREKERPRACPPRIRRGPRSRSDAHRSTASIGEAEVAHCREQKQLSSRGAPATRDLLRLR